MNEPGFEILDHEHGLPVRSRSLFPESLVFQHEHTATVLVTSAVYRELRTAAAKARHREVGGLLVGRCFRDNAGPYVNVLAHVQAPLTDGTAGRIHLTAERTAELRKHAERNFPSMDVVGWWHSHPSPSGFSPVDKNTQQLWSDPLHIGILVFSTGHEWGRVYLGPDSVRLSPLPAAQPSVDTGHQRTTAEPAEPPRDRRRRVGWRSPFSRVSREAPTGQQQPTAVERDMEPTVDRDKESQRRDDALFAAAILLALILGIVVLVLVLLIAFSGR